MTKSIFDAGEQLLKMANAVPEAERKALQKAATASKRTIDGIGGRMRNIGKKGANLTATYTVSATQASVKPKPVGAWTIAESGARKHEIGGRKRRVYIHAGGYSHPVRGPIHHPGAKGRRVWTRASQAAERIAIPILKAEMVAGTIKRFF